MIKLIDFVVCCSKKFFVNLLCVNGYMVVFNCVFNVLVIRLSVIGLFLIIVIENIIFFFFFRLLVVNIIMI